jgi:hypothetical protein
MILFREQTHSETIFKLFMFSQQCGNLFQMRQFFFEILAEFSMENPKNKPKHRWGAYVNHVYIRFPQLSFDN